MPKPSSRLTIKKIEASTQKLTEASSSLAQKLYAEQQAGAQGGAEQSSSKVKKAPLTLSLKKSKKTDPAAALRRSVLFDWVKQGYALLCCF